ncbi:hypothetical protein EHV15_35950 [Paenibacillus oralis]|uniref:Uncharacterized protein n=1 Tax=Paenibacillus oralis TaxID=2490856 RepID=A0A3P3TA86_9BACL|nr:hypothetical protein [Paenibacillus oralis]RRJ54965.1 hypothetical protein EHV15_35950 [Paenibacillus oralis]
MTGKNQEHIQTLAETIFNMGRESIMNNIMDGTFNLDDFVESQEGNIRKELDENWETLVGTGNPYWDRGSITENDLKFIMGRLMHELCLKLPEIIKKALKEGYHAWQLEYVETLTQVKDLTVSLCQKENVGSTRELMNLQTKVLFLQSVSSLIEKARLFFTAQQLKIDPVAIPVLTFPSELEIKVAQANEPIEISEIAVTASVSATSPTPETQIESTPTGRKKTTKTTTGNEGTMNENEIGTVHIFERSLVNGFVNTVEYKPAFVPEKIIRERDFEHGDKIRVVNVRPVGDKIHYDFELAEKTNSHPSHRIQINLCIVEQDTGGLFVQRADSGQTKVVFDGAERKFYLKEHDITRLKLTGGDIVDIAFWSNDPETVRVVWKHYI